MPNQKITQLQFTGDKEGNGSYLRAEADRVLYELYSSKSRQSGHTYYLLTVKKPSVEAPPVGDPGDKRVMIFNTSKLIRFTAIEPCIKLAQLIHDEIKATGMPLFLMGEVAQRLIGKLREEYPLETVVHGGNRESDDDDTSIRQSVAFLEQIFSKTEDKQEREHIAVAVRQLMKRFPVPPLTHAWEPNCCPTCNEDIGGTCDDGRFQNPHYDLCPFCAQKLDNSDEALYN